MILPSIQLLESVAQGILFKSFLSFIPHIPSNFLIQSPKYFPQILNNNSSKLLENLFVLSWCFLPCKGETKRTFSLDTLGLWAELNTLGTLCLPIHFSWDSEMTSLICEFRKNKPSMLSSALLSPLGNWLSLLFPKEQALLHHMGLPESSITETGWVSLSNSGDQ